MFFILFADFVCVHLLTHIITTSPHHLHRESAAAYVMKDLLEERALLSVYDPQVHLLKKNIYFTLMMLHFLDAFGVWPILLYNNTPRHRLLQ